MNHTQPIAVQPGGYKSIHPYSIEPYAHGQTSLHQPASHCRLPGGYKGFPGGTGKNWR